MRSVALVGRSPETKELSWNSKADELWGVGVVYRDNVPPLDRLYELHPLWHLRLESYSPEHWDWLQQDHGPLKIYMQEVAPEIPNAVEFPIMDLADLCSGLWRWDAEQTTWNDVQYYTSSIDWMVAHAIYEQVDVIEFYGIDLGIETEYVYQRPGLAFWIGQAVARGIDVVLPDNSPICKSLVYGYEGAQMITRHKAERVRLGYQNEIQVKLASLNALEATVSGARDEWFNDQGNPDKEKVFQAAYEDVQEARKQLFLYEGAKQVCDFFIQECDLQDVDYMELKNPFSRVSITPKSRQMAVGGTAVLNGEPAK